MGNVYFQVNVLKSFSEPGQNGWDHYVLNPSSVVAKQRYVAYIRFKGSTWDKKQAIQGFQPPHKGGEIMGPIHLPQVFPLLFQSKRGEKRHVVQISSPLCDGRVRVNIQEDYKIATGALKMSNEELISTNEKLHGNRRSAAKDQIGGRHAFHRRGRGPDRDGRWYRMCAMIHRSKDKRIEGTVLTSIQKTHDELESRVQKRTAELEKLNEELSKEIEKRKKFEADLKLQHQKILTEQERRKYLSKKLVEILERERQEIAESLHHDVGQILAKINMDLDDVIDSALDAPIKADALVKIQSSIMESMDYVSWLSGSLRPHILENLGLVPAIRNMLNMLKENSSLRFHFHTEEDCLQVDDEKALAIYRIIQEAVTNSIKHAGAENIIVSLARKDEFVSITIEDDGTGFEYDKISAGEGKTDKLGLIIMFERAIQIGGEFRVKSQVGKGTRVIVEAPVE